MGVELGWRLDLLRAGAVGAALGRRDACWQGAELEAVWHAFHRRIWEEAAAHVGATLNDLGRGFLALRRGERSTVVWQYHVKLDDPVTLRLALDKAVCHRLLADGGLPTVEHVAFDAGDLATARRFLSDSVPCVVKPASGTAGGSGVTCGVRHDDDLLRACLRARRWSHRLLIERQVRGDEYRLLFLDGALLGAVRRRPPVLVGDGQSTIASLIRTENDRRAAGRGVLGLRAIGIDLDCLLALRDAGLSLRSVPEAGAVVRVKSTANANGPSDNDTARNLGEGLVADAARAASLLGVRLAGVDVVTPDPTAGLGPSHGVVVEVNGTPGLHYHYLVADPAEAIPVAVPILETLLGTARRTQCNASMIAAAAAAVPTATSGRRATS